MSGFTPGPWGAIAGSNHISIYGLRKVVAHTPSSGSNTEGERVNMANARLIAAAPDLLSALERLERNFDLILHGKPVRDVAETKAEVASAIAKARGQS